MSTVFNVFQKAQASIMRKVYKSTATITYNVKNNAYDPATGKITENIVTFSRTINVSNPKSVSEYLVSTSGYLAGDLYVDVAYKELIDALSYANGDPTATVNEVERSLSDLRSGETMTGGIRTESDTLTMNGVVWRFVKIIQKSFWHGAPCLLRLQLREVNNRG